MGCDSFIGTENMHILLPPEETKIFTLELKLVGAKKEQMIFGFAGSFRSAQVIKYNLTLPVFDSDDITSEMEYLVNYLVTDIKKIHRKNGILKDENGIEESEGCLLLGWRKKLYYIDDDYAVIPSITPYATIGSGEIVSYGSLHATLDTKLTAEDRINIALKSASTNNNFVREPFYIDNI
jgi:ATP-dependent protease HslVU (ClpYQ) peptidase subunit